MKTIEVITNEINFLNYKLGILRDLYDCTYANDPVSQNRISQEITIFEFTLNRMVNLLKEVKKVEGVK